MRLRSLENAAGTAVTALRANPVRTLLATLGVVIGSAALVAVLAIGDGVERYARSQARSEGFHRVAVLPITDDTVDGQLVARSDVASLGVPDLESVASSLIPGERATLARTGVALTEIGAPRRQRALATRGVVLAGEDTLDQPLSAGRGLTAAESRDAAPVAVVNRMLARVLLGDSAAPLDNALGDSLPLGSTWVRVVGVLADAEGPSRRALSVTVPLALAEPAYVSSRRGTLPASLVISTDRVEAASEMRARVEQWLASRDATWERRYRVDARSERQLSQVRRGMLIFRLLMGSITGITLIVGGIGIMNVLLASVAERTREIGVRKAIGARRLDILFQFLAESVAITGMGSAIGTALGLGGAYAVTAVMRSQAGAVIYAAATPQTLLLSALLAVLVGLVFGCYPAARAALLTPIEAIHTE